MRHISYQEMKEIMQFLREHNIHFEFGNDYTTNDIIIGHFCEGSIELYTEELDEADEAWNADA